MYFIQNKPKLKTNQTYNPNEHLRHLKHYSSKFNA